MTTKNQTTKLIIQIFQRWNIIVPFIHPEFSEYWDIRDLGKESLYRNVFGLMLVSSLIKIGIPLLLRLRLSWLINIDLLIILRWLVWLLLLILSNILLLSLLLRVVGVFLIGLSLIRFFLFLLLASSSVFTPSCRSSHVSIFDFHFKLFS